MSLPSQDSFVESDDSDYLPSSDTFDGSSLLEAIDDAIEQGRHDIHVTSKGVEVSATLDEELAKDKAQNNAEAIAKLRQRCSDLGSIISP